ncbi:DsbA family protein [Candidatus Pacearchaeota archaeon]|nr:DsbA family protein [Candidatus Pacearchaeota archaeon]
MKENSETSKDTIDIPVGKWLQGVRRNPWILISIILAIVIVVMFFWRAPVVSPGIVNAQVAADNAVKFINSQGQGTVTLSGVAQKGPFYEVKLSFQGQEVPVFVTVDGNYIVPNPLAISPTAPSLVPQQQQRPPADTKVEVTEGDSPVKGSKSAKIAIVEFSDYECPFCKKFYIETYKQIVKDYVDTGKARIVFKDFPLSIHSKAQKAHEAALCVKEQLGDMGYFKMHDKLFENQESLSIENYKKWAREFDSSGVKFDQCLDTGKYESKVKENLAYGQQLGVTGTPAFFINGKPVRGAQPYEVLKRLIDAELTSA